MGACSTCLDCGENHWESCDPAGYRKCNHCGELYGVTEAIREHEANCQYNRTLIHAKRLLDDLDAQLACDGDSDSPEADDLRGKLEDAWKGMGTEDRKEFLLYAVRDTIPTFRKNL